jgi:kynureninase
LGARSGRTKILTEPGNFPTDLYIAQGIARLLPHHVLHTAQAEDIVQAIDEDTAVVMLTHVHYKTGRKFDMAAVSAAAHAKGALILWDLSHSTGAVQVELNRCDADLAVGCGYKYLNGGPGAPAFLFVAERLQARLHSPLAGWMGHARPFEFADGYEPGPGIGRFACGTPPIIGLAALEQGVEMMLEADFNDIVAKSEALSASFISAVEDRCAGSGLTLASPRDPARRGSHVSFAHPNAYEVCRALIDRGVVGDFRAPEILRFGLTPLYTSFADVWHAAECLAEVLASRAWDSPGYRLRTQVT